MSVPYFSVFFTKSSKLERIIAKNPNIPPTKRFISRMSEPNKTDNTPVNTAENGIIIATIEASICFMELVRIVQHRADVMRVNKITNNMCKGLNEKKIFSKGAIVPETVSIFTEFRITADTKDRKKPVSA